MKKTAILFALFLAPAMGVSATAVTAQGAIEAASRTSFEALARSTTIHTLTVNAINWHVGDVNNYSVDMSIAKGTIAMSVREEIEQGYWLVQDINLMGQAQKAEVLIDKNNGQILKMIVNGKEQEVPKANLEIIEMKESEVTVPAGTFKAIYVKARDKDKNQIIEQWVNPKEIPISGMLKSIAPTGMGFNMTTELTSFKRAP